ncbi:MAG TPA: ribbon-helix-helix protein, CopG family [Candidatus Sulfotelmatobacter sp.]|nr:ribbon-helix-helix protein, CopG family [Candidatus Sulfotelmatobacter sp.]
MDPVIPIQMPQEQADLISEAAEELHMSRQDVIRQTLKLYLPDFVDRMNPKPKLRRRISGWEALRGGRGIELDIKPINQTVKKNRSRPGTR